MTLYSFYLEKACLIDINKINIKLIFRKNHDENTPLMCTLFYYEPIAI
jgi:hypothetical protein